jgi:hypothetical protein
MVSNNRWIPFGLALSLLLIPHRVLAHHGFANFQMDQTSTIKGSVVDYELINPHVQITLKVEQEGKSVEWNVEGVSLNMIVRAGFKKDSLKVGDIVSITGHPGKNGRPVLLLMKITWADGRVLSAPYE